MKSKYLIASSVDMKWGVAVTCVGFQKIDPGQAYPPSNHPASYVFNKVQGRILNEYQIVYIEKGQGIFVSNSLSHAVNITAGTLLMLFPGEWHTYWPDEDTGWQEYWIGFKGPLVNSWITEGFFTRKEPISYVGLKPDIISLYKEAIEIAQTQGVYYQHRLGGVTTHIMGLTRFYKYNQPFSGVNKLMERAKILIEEQFQTITPEILSDQLSMSYSNFRRVFKNYVGMPPIKYIQQVKLNHAKEALTFSDLSVKQIASEVGFCDMVYLCLLFRSSEGMTPLEYRKKTRGVK